MMKFPEPDKNLSWYIHKFPWTNGDKWLDFRHDEPRQNTFKDSQNNVLLMRTTQGHSDNETCQWSSRRVTT